MDIANRLLVLTPLLERIGRLSDQVWYMVGNCSIYYSEQPTVEELKTTRERFHEESETYTSSWQKFRELYKLLDDPRLDLVGYREDAKQYQYSIFIFAFPESPEECRDAAESLVECSEHFFRWMTSIREKEFGFWGNRFLEYIIEQQPVERAEEVARQFASDSDFFFRFNFSFASKAIG